MDCRKATFCTCPPVDRKTSHQVLTSILPRIGASLPFIPIPLAELPSPREVGIQLNTSLVDVTSELTEDISIATLLLLLIISAPKQAPTVPRILARVARPSHLSPKLVSNDIETLIVLGVVVRKRVLRLDILLFKLLSNARVPLPIAIRHFLITGLTQSRMLLNTSPVGTLFLAEHTIVPMAPLFLHNGNTRVSFIFVSLLY